jgi:type 1 fimbria pilin
MLHDIGSQGGRAFAIQPRPFSAKMIDCADSRRGGTLLVLFSGTTNKYNFFYYTSIYGNQRNILEVGSQIAVAYLSGNKL